MGKSSGFPFLVGLGDEGLSFLPLILNAGKKRREQDLLQCLLLQVP